MISHLDLGSSTRRFLLGLTLFALAASGRARAATFTIDAGKSRLEVLTRKAGFFSRMGHAHTLRATKLSGQVVADPHDIAASRLDLAVEAASLTVTDAALAEKDRISVKENMDGEKVLDIARFPRIQFKSRSVRGEPQGKDRWSVTIEGSLGLHGVDKQITVPCTVTMKGGILHATGDVELRQPDFGIRPFRAVMGAVGVGETVKVQFDIEAHVAAGR